MSERMLANLLSFADLNWPTAKLTCFEVLPHRVAELRSWCEQDGNAVVIETLLGAKTKRGAPIP